MFAYADNGEVCERDGEILRVLELFKGRAGVVKALAGFPVAADGDVECSKIGFGGRGAAFGICRRWPDPIGPGIEGFAEEGFGARGLAPWAAMTARCPRMRASCGSPDGRVSRAMASARLAAC